MKIQVTQTNINRLVSVAIGESVIMVQSFRFVCVLLALMFLSGCAGLNSYTTNGTLKFENLKSNARIIRDEKGMAYIYADQMDDALFALGFATAQDRLFQMALTKLFAAGRICELAGEKARPLDIRHRTIGFYRNAKKHAKLLNPATRAFFQNYANGVNAFMAKYKDEIHLEFKLAGISPEPWTIEDCLTLLYYMSWNSAANLKTEVIAQMLVEKLGPEKAATLFPININPDDEQNQRVYPSANLLKGPCTGVLNDPALLSFLGPSPYAMGSNNWVTGPKLSKGNLPIVSNDPHLKSSMLPGPWYPAGIITPCTRIVGVHIPGLPAMPIFRNNDVAVGITNSYADAQDLYVETLDPANPGHYLEGDRSIAFDRIEETLRIKDKDAKGDMRTEKIMIRLTQRGPVVSTRLPGLKTKHVLTLRWAPFETMGPSLGLNDLMTARSAADVKAALSKANGIMLNFVFGDKNGDIGRHASGKIPVRSQNDGTLPHVVKDGIDNWTGWIPFEKMPHAVNPEKGWIGTCNHKTIEQDYPYYYSSHQASSYRYRRLKALMDAQTVKTGPDDHWRFQRDTLNLLAKIIVPEITPVLRHHPDLKDLSAILSSWNFKDGPLTPAPTIFHAIYERMAFITFEDELGEDLAKTMLTNWYFWHERFQQMVLTGASSWFDNVTTAGKTEGFKDIVVAAGLSAKKELSQQLGPNPDKWKWGRVHTLSLLNPIRRKGVGASLLGAGTHPAPGSGETLCRGIYMYRAPFKTVVTASLRMTADLSDNDKVLAVLPGGVTGRTFHPHFKDQVAAFMNGDKLYWWFSDNAIAEHRQSELTLSPAP